MSSICLVLLAHHSERLRPISEFDVDDTAPGDAVDASKVVDDEATRQSLAELAEQALLPAMTLLAKLLDKHAAFNFALAPTGPLLRSAELHEPTKTALEHLCRHERVSLIATPGDRSILSILPTFHATAQLDAARKSLGKRFGKRVRTAANTELIYDDAFAERARLAGFSHVLCGLADRHLGGRSANVAYRAPSSADGSITVVARQAGLSDDLGVRFSDPAWEPGPIDAETYADWVRGSLDQSSGNAVPIVLHLSDFGRTHPGPGLLTLLEDLPEALFKRGIGFTAPGELKAPADRVLSVPQATSAWSPACDLSPWLSNAMQSNVLDQLNTVLRDVNELDASGSAPEKVAEARRVLEVLAASDHLAAMRYRPMPDSIKATRVDEPTVDLSAASAELRRRPPAWDSAYDAYLAVSLHLRKLSKQLLPTSAAAATTTQ